MMDNLAFSLPFSTKGINSLPEKGTEGERERHRKRPW